MTAAPHTVLAIDIGTNLGWAFAKDGVITAWGVEDFRLKGDEHNGSGRRLIQFHNWLQDFCGVDEVFYERVGANMRNAGANQSHFEMRGILSMFCYGSGIPLLDVHNITLKKKFAGHGRATKEEMCATAHHLGWNGGIKGTGQDHDAADAVALIFCLLRDRGIQVTFKS